MSDGFRPQDGNEKTPFRMASCTGFCVLRCFLESVIESIRRFPVSFVAVKRWRGGLTNPIQRHAVENVVRMPAVRNHTGKLARMTLYDPVMI